MTRFLALDSNMSKSITFEAADVRFLASTTVVLVFSAVAGEVAWPATAVATLVSFFRFSHRFTESLLGVPGFPVIRVSEFRVADMQDVGLVSEFVYLFIDQIDR